MAFQCHVGPFERIWFASLYVTTDSSAARSAQLGKFGEWHARQIWPVLVGGDFNMEIEDTGAWCPPECAIAATGHDVHTCIGPGTSSSID